MPSCFMGIGLMTKLEKIRRKIEKRMDFVHPPQRIGHPEALVQPASGRSTRLGGLVLISGSLSPGSPAEAGEPGVIHGLIRYGGSHGKVEFRTLPKSVNFNFAYGGPARRVQLMNNHGCNPWNKSKMMFSRTRNSGSNIKIPLVNQFTHKSVTKWE